MHERLEMKKPKQLMPGPPVHPMSGSDGQDIGARARRTQRAGKAEATDIAPFWYLLAGRSGRTAQAGKATHVEHCGPTARLKLNVSRRSSSVNAGGHQS